MIIGIDVDGVCADLHTPWLARYNEDYDDNLTVDRIHQWDMVPAVKPECGKKIFKYLSEAGLYENMPQMDGALDGVNALRELGHTILFITSCVRGQGDQKIEWLVRNKFVDESANGIVALYGKDPAKSCVHADILIDDYDGNFKGWKTNAILFDAPYNKSANGNWERAATWVQVLLAVDNIATWRPTFEHIVSV